MCRPGECPRSGQYALYLWYGDLTCKMPSKTSDQAAGEWAKAGGGGLVLGAPGNSNTERPPCRGAAWKRRLIVPFFFFPFMVQDPVLRLVVPMRPPESLCLGLITGYLLCLCCKLASLILERNFITSPAAFERKKETLI